MFDLAVLTSHVLRVRQAWHSRVISDDVDMATPSCACFVSAGLRERRGFMGQCDVDHLQLDVVVDSASHVECLARTSEDRGDRRSERSGYMDGVDVHGVGVGGGRRATSL
jgi:hypothetical protein